MEIRYSGRAEMTLQRVRERNEDEFHSLRGLINQLAALPEADGETKFIRRSGCPVRVYRVYEGKDWIIYYRISGDDDDESEIGWITIISIWSASRPPHTRL